MDKTCGLQVKRNMSKFGQNELYILKARSLVGKGKQEMSLLEIVKSTYVKGHRTLM